jgi:hypothetical protein
LKNLAKIIHVAKQFGKVHLSILSSFAFLPETNRKDTFLRLYGSIAVS